MRCEYPGWQFGVFFASGRAGERSVFRASGCTTRHGWNEATEKRYFRFIRLLDWDGWDIVHGTEALIADRQDTWQRDWIDLQRLGTQTERDFR